MPVIGALSRPSIQKAGREMTELMADIASFWQIPTDHF